MPSFEDGQSMSAASRISSRPASASSRARTPSGTVTTSPPWPMRRPCMAGIPSGAISSSNSSSTVRLWLPERPLLAGDAALEVAEPDPRALLQLPRVAQMRQEAVDARRLLVGVFEEEDLPARVDFERRSEERVDERQGAADELSLCDSRHERPR